MEDLTAEQKQQIVSEFLKDEKNKDIIAEIAKGQGYESPEEIAGLKSQNERLLAEKKKHQSASENLKKQLDELQNNTQVDGVDTSDEKLRHELREARAKIAKFDELDAKYKEVESSLITNIVSNHMSRALDAAGIAKEHKSLLQQAFQGKAKAEILEGKEFVYILDSGNETPIEDYFKSFVNSEQGSIYKDKPVNVGAGSQNISSGISEGKVITQSQFDSMKPKERAAFFDGGGEIKKE